MKSLTAQSIVLHDCFLPCYHWSYAQSKVSWLLVCPSAYWKPFFGSALRLLCPVCTVARLIYPPVRDSLWSSISFQTYEILLVYARPTTPDRLVLLLSSMSQFLSVCFPSDFHGRELPYLGFVKAQPINGAIGFCRNGAKIFCCSCLLWWAGVESNHRSRFFRPARQPCTPSAHIEKTIGFEPIFCVST